MESEKGAEQDSKKWDCMTNAFKIKQLNGRLKSKRIGVGQEDLV